MEHGLLYGPPGNRKLELVAVNDSRLSIRPVTGNLIEALACMMKPHAPVPISGKASMRRKSRRVDGCEGWSFAPC
jgi:hypothetical protein